MHLNRLIPGSLNDAAVISCIFSAKTTFSFQYFGLRNRPDSQNRFEINCRTASASHFVSISLLNALLIIIVIFQEGCRSSISVRFCAEFNVGHSCVKSFAPSFRPGMNFVKFGIDLVSDGMEGY